MIYSNRPINAQLPILAMKHSYEYQIITRVESFKFLGVYFDPQMTFKYHASHLTSKLSQITAMIDKVRKFLPKHILKILYFAHVQSLISYCINIWGGTSQTHLQSLVLILKRIIRSINNAGYLDHTKPLYKANKILNLTDLYKYNSVLNYFKSHILHQNQNRLRHNHLTRNRNMQPPDRHRRTIFERSFIYSGPKFYNLLPPRMKTILTLNKFKRELKAYYLSLY